MRVNRKFATIGFLIILVPLLGIPDSWKYALIIILGLVVIFTATEFLPPKRKMNRRKGDIIKNSDTFSENSYVERKLEPKKEEFSYNPEELERNAEEL